MTIWSFLVRRTYLSAKKQPRENKRNQIIEAASNVFAEKGFTGASIAHIAVQAGIGKGTTYEYFRSKEDLFFAVFEWHVQQSSQAATVNIAALGCSASDRLSIMNESLMNYFVDRMDIFSLVMEFWAASASSRIQERFKLAFKNTYKEFRGIVAALIQDGIDRGEFRADIDVAAIAAGIVGMWDALFLQGWFDESFDIADTGRKCMAVFLKGLDVKE
jgi:AcrR family transcriptional regulator